MLWGLPSGPDPAWTTAVQTPGTKYILGFNEPDLTYSGSANILPANAAQGYITYMEPFSGGVKVGMPNVLWNNVGSSSGGIMTLRSGLNTSLETAQDVTSILQLFTTIKTATRPTAKVERRGSRAMLPTHTILSICQYGSLNSTAMEQMSNKFCFYNKCYPGWTHEAM